MFTYKIPSTSVGIDGSTTVQLHDVRVTYYTLFISSNALGLKQQKCQTFLDHDTRLRMHLSHQSLYIIISGSGRL